MDIQFFDNGHAPKPKAEIRIEDLQTEVYPDRFRVWVKVTVTPFQERPNLIMVLRDSEGAVVSELTIIETMHANMEFTMHLRGMDDPAGDYRLEVDLFYETRNPAQDHAELQVMIPNA